METLPLRGSVADPSSVLGHRGKAVAGGGLLVAEMLSWGAGQRVSLSPGLACPFAKPNVHAAEGS